MPGSVAVAEASTSISLGSGFYSLPWLHRPATAGGITCIDRSTNDGAGGHDGTRVLRRCFRRPKHCTVALPRSIMSAEQATSSPVPEVRAGAASAAAANDNDPLTWTKTDESRRRRESCPNGLKTRNTGTCNRESEAPSRIPIASKAPGKYSKTDVLGVRCEDASCSNLETDTDCATARSLQRAPPSDDPAARPMVAGSSGGFTGGVLAPSPRQLGQLEGWCSSAPAPEKAQATVSDFRGSQLCPGHGGSRSRALEPHPHRSHPLLSSQSWSV